MEWGAVLLSGFAATLVTLAVGRFSRWYSRPRPRWMLAGSLADKGTRAAWRVVNCGDGTAFRVQVRVERTTPYVRNARAGPTEAHPRIDGKAMAVCPPGDKWLPDDEQGDGLWIIAYVDEQSSVIVTWDESPTNRRWRNGCEQRLTIVDEVIDITPHRA